MKSMTLLLIVMVISFVVAGLWQQVPIIKESVHLVLDPTAGSLLNWNLVLGMIIIVLGISLIMTLVQKYGTDQETLRQMKKEQKELQVEMKKYRNDPEKLLEFNKKQMEHMPRMFEITMKPLIYTVIPFILFFRWFSDYFATPALEGFRFFGFLNWFWFYLIFSIFFSSIWRKTLKVV